MTNICGEMNVHKRKLNINKKIGIRRKKRYVEKYESIILHKLKYMIFYFAEFA